MFIISKEFDMCYGHRVWAQTLDGDLSLNAKCKCRGLHGHNSVIKVSIKGKELNDQGMVTDFNNLSWFKKTIDEVIDHKFIMDVNDPLLKNFFMRDYGVLYTGETNGLIYDKISVRIPEVDPVLKEMYDSLVIVNFIPTSENLARWMARAIEKTMSHIPDVKVNSIEFFETPKSSSTYIYE